MPGEASPTPAGTHWYRAHGLTISADFAIPELRPAEEHGACDLRIAMDPAVGMPQSHPPGEMTAPARGHARDGHLQIGTSPNDVTLSVRGIAQYRVRAGREIRIAPAPGSDPGLVTLYAIGSAMGLALLQREALVLHGAGILGPDGALLFLGPSGIGKSTLAAGLAQRGFPSLGDDTVALWPGNDPGTLAAYPAIHAFKLWKDALDGTGAAAADLVPLANRADKFYLPNPRAAEDRPHALAGIYLLEDAGAGEDVSIVPMDTLEAVKGVGDNVYRPGFVDVMGLTTAQFQGICALVAGVSVARLRRPRTHVANDRVAEILRSSAGR